MSGVIGVSRLSQYLMNLFLVIFLVSLFEIPDAEARKRRGRGVRRGGAARVAARRGRGGRRVVKRGGGRGRNRIAAAPAAAAGSGAINDINDANRLAGLNLDFNGNAGRDLRVLDGFSNLAVNGQGQFFEVDPRFVSNGVILNQNAAIRQPILVGQSGNLVAGQLTGFLPDTLQQVQSFNGAGNGLPIGSIAAQPGAAGVVAPVADSQVVNLRRTAE